MTENPDDRARQFANMLANGRRMMWYEVDLPETPGIMLPHASIQGPYNEEGEECAWPWDPIQLKGAPIGQYHCPYCGAMVIAGFEHLDYGPHDENGLNWLDHDYALYMKAHSDE